MAGPTIRLAEMCDLVTDRVKPSECPGAFYLGLEHLAQAVSAHRRRAGIRYEELNVGVRSR